MALHMSRSLKSALKRLDDEVARDLLTTEKDDIGNYLSMRSGFLTYLPKSRIETAEKKYASRLRIRGKAAKIARKFCAEDHSDEAFEKFHNAFSGNAAFSVKNLEIVKGEAIFDVYNKHYDKRRQSIRMNSCMVGENKTPRDFELYIDNPESVRLLVLWDTFKGEKVAIGRALIWKTDKGIYVDRIYGSSPAEAFIKNYIEKKGWLRFLHYDERGQNDILRVEVKKDYYPYLPYLDTFGGTIYTSRDGMNYIHSGF